MRPSRRSLWLPAIAYMALLFAASEMSSPPTVGPDTAQHAFAYAVLGTLLARAFGGGLRRVRGRAAGLAWLSAIAYGAFDEFHQSYVPEREASLKDLAMDALGSGLAVFVVWSFARSRRHPSEEVVP